MSNKIKCPVCGDTFSKSGIITHMKYKHPDYKGDVKIMENKSSNVDKVEKNDINNNVDSVKDTGSKQNESSETSQGDSPELNRQEVVVSKEYLDAMQAQIDSLKEMVKEGHEVKSVESATLNAQEYLQNDTVVWGPKNPLMVNVKKEYRTTGKLYWSSPSKAQYRIDNGAKALRYCDLETRFKSHVLEEGNGGISENSLVERHGQYLLWLPPQYVESRNDYLNGLQPSIKDFEDEFKSATGDVGYGEVKINKE